jgi:hypothetical protein
VIFRAYRLKKDPTLRPLGSLLEDKDCDSESQQFQRKIWRECLTELMKKMNQSFFTER